MDFLIDAKIANDSKLLKANGAEKVFLFGSRLKGNSNRDSDYDFGVKGLPQEKFFSSWASLENALDTKVDLVDFDDQIDFFCHLQKHGEIKEIN